MSAPKKGGWGSVFSGAVANLESRLDTILANEAEPAAPPPTREAARSRVNERLAERLAKATAQKTPSRTSTPVNDAASARPSGEERRSQDVSRPTTANEAPSSPTTTALSTDGRKDIQESRRSIDVPSRPLSLDAGPLLTSRLPINPARISIDSSRPSLDASRDDVPSRPSVEISNGTAMCDAAELQARLEQMESDHAQAEVQRQEEMHNHLERIDALQAKLTYLAKETVAAAKEANASNASTDLDKQIAEKDERIALLMEEGEKLSKTEMRHLQTIKKLRAKNTEDERAVAELKRKLDRAEKAETDLKAKLRRSENAERSASEKVKSIAIIEKQVDELREDRENASELIRNLTIQLTEAKERATKAEKEASTNKVDRDTIARLQNELEDAQIEKSLAQDRATAEIRKINEEAERKQEQFNVREVELKNEIAGLEARLEATRARVEEASASAGAAGVDGESSVKLMRQVETLQQQYSLAKGNWETIETSLNARVAALEKERDEATRRESEVRKKARDTAGHSRKFEDGLEAANEQIKNLKRELKARQDQVSNLETRLEQADSVHSDTRAELERQRKLWEADLQQRLEDEKQKWRREMGGFSPGVRNESPTFSRRGSPAFDASSLHIRRPTARLNSQDLASLHHDPRGGSRRSSAVPPNGPSRTQTVSTDASLELSRRESETNSIPPTPSIEIDQHPSEDFEDIASPQQTLGDFFSTSTAGPGVGPSVQLVERMSALVRKLESEKASFKDELNRLNTQRDDARNEVVELMREIEEKRQQDAKVASLEKELLELKGHYNASLEMLGEREEQVEELKMDVKELKTIYRELVETKVGGGTPSS